MPEARIIAKIIFAYEKNNSTKKDFHFASEILHKEVRNYNSDYTHLSFNMKMEDTFLLPPIRNWLDPFPNVLESRKKLR